jgi:hypothetical protein
MRRQPSVRPKKPTTIVDEAGTDVNDIDRECGGS